MKITFVHPPITLTSRTAQPQMQPPLGMAYLAACARDAGHTVRVVDGVGEGIGRYSRFGERHCAYGLPIAEILDRIDADTDVIGVGIMFSNFWPISKVLIREIRARFPRAVIVCGGEHVTAVTRFVMEDAPAHYAVVGEGEETTLELLAHLAGAPGSLPLERIAGLVFRTADGAIVTTPRRQRRRTLDELPWPAWDLFPLERYLDARLFGAMSFDSTQRPMVIIATRGCPYTCKFCSNEGMWGINYFARDPRDVVDEIEFYMREYGATDFHFQDLTLIINRRWAERLCDEIIARNLGITWKTASGTRSEALDRALLDKMARSGCDELILAPESGSAEIGRVSRKRVKLEKVLAVARMIRDARLPMRVTGFMIIGYPEERLRDVLQTYRFLVQMVRAGFSTVCVHRFTAYPGCEYHDIAVRGGRIVHTDEYFLSLEKGFPFNPVSWHPRWSGAFIFALITVAYCLFFGSYYLSKPLLMLRAVWRVALKRPQTRFERYFAYRVWGPLAIRRDASVPPRAPAAPLGAIAVGDAMAAGDGEASVG
jgi:radical SAM superfamily enzyme YgiQ (UPF0313 family)